MSVQAELVAAPSAVSGPLDDGRDRRSRGRLVLSDGVVEKIAGQVVAEIGATYGTSGGFLGFGGHADGSARPRVQVTLSEQSADVTVRAGVGYPASLRRAAEQIRAAVVDRVHAYTGVAVHRVDIEIAFLAPAGNAADDRSTGDRGRLR